MGKWKATMPKEEPKPGMAHVVLAYKTEHGRRFEFTGQLPRELADKIMVEACTEAGKKGGDA